MKTLLIIAAALTFLGWAAHYFLGTKEMVSTKVSSTGKILTNWFQGLCAWHLITVDLIMLTLAFVLLAFTDLVKTKNDVLNFIGFWMMGWALAWIATLLLSKDGKNHIKKLSQWVIFVILAICSFWAANF